MGLVTTVPEPPDGTRLEFEFGTDLYAIWRNDLESARAGYVYGDGGRTWTFYGSATSHTWQSMIDEFGADVLRNAVRLLVHPEDAHKSANWPTQENLRKQVFKLARKGSR